MACLHRLKAVRKQSVETRLTWCGRTGGANRCANATQRKILWLAMLTFMVSILYNSMLIDMVPGHFYALVLLNLVWFPWPARVPGMPEARAPA